MANARTEGRRGPIVRFCITPLLSCCFIYPVFRIGVTDDWFYRKLKVKNVSCEYDRLNGWNSTLQAAWYIRHVRWTCLSYISFIIWFLWAKPAIWLLIPGTQFHNIYTLYNDFCSCNSSYLSALNSHSWRFSTFCKIYFEVYTSKYIFSIPFNMFALLCSLPSSRNSDPGSHSRLFSPPTNAMM